MSYGAVMGGLALLFAISKEVIVFNAETVVAVSTVLTMGLIVKYGGQSFLKVLDEEATQIEEAFEQSRKLEKEMVQELRDYYVTQGTLAKELEELQKSLTQQVQTWLETRQAYLEADWKRSLEQKLQRLAGLEKQALDAFQSTFVQVFTQQAFDASWGEVTEDQLVEMETLLGEGRFPSWELREKTSEKDKDLKEFEYVASLVVQPVTYEFLGEASQLKPQVFQDPNSQVEFYYEDDFYA